ncbi:chitin synthase [Rhypophila decipiens]
MPEVPQNMQEDLQRMELEARSVEPKQANNYGSWNNQSDAGAQGFKPFQSNGNDQSTMDLPSFSPFPKVKGENIPPSDEEKEEILYQARNLVLHSNNVAMQVTWARDALIWVEVAAEARAIEWKREGNGSRERPATPKTQHDLRVDAVNIIDYLAGQDHPDASFMKGKWLEFGKWGYRENKREAYSWYRKAAEHGCGRAEYRMGMLYENANDIPNAIKHYTLGVQLKDSASNYRLGMMHLMGQHGHQKDVLQGLAMIQEAADTADEDAPQGCYVYGMLIARELPDITIPDQYLPLDVSAARQYIEKAAYLGFAKAQLKMGQAYELSQLGCDFNPPFSLHYYGLAARQGQPEAALGVSRWFLFGFEGAFAKNEALAFRYAQDAAHAGLATGEFAVGYYYEIGIHVQKDIPKARKWYEQAAEHGNKDAEGRLDALRQSKTLSKKDHETTTLTRIKSQHGSQRGARPERFTRQNDVLPTLSEGRSGSPGDVGPQAPGNSRPSPPRHTQSLAAEGTIDFPDPSYRSASTKPPAFTVNLNPNLAPRPKSTAPYPEEDRPPPLTLRPKSTAPYPDDDMNLHKPPLSPHYHPNIRPSSAAGPHADRPGSAFGIRPPAGPQGASLGPQGRLQPQAPSNYRQPSPGGASLRPDYRPPQDQHAQRLGQANMGPGSTVPAGAAPVGDPTRTRLTKTNPNYDKPQPMPQVPAHGPYQSASQPNLVPPNAGAQPGRDYGPRTSSRPVSDSYDRYGAGPPPANNIRPERFDSMQNTSNHARLPSGGGGAPLKQRPGLAEVTMSGGRSSAPPAQAGRPTPATHPSHASSAASVVSVASTTKLPGHGGPSPRPQAKPLPTDHPDGKTMGQGPATFEEMGIPQGKNDSDCVVM